MFVNSMYKKFNISRSGLYLLSYSEDSFHKRQTYRIKKHIELAKMNKEPKYLIGLMEKKFKKEQIKSESLSYKVEVLVCDKISKKITIMANTRVCSSDKQLRKFALNFQKEFSEFVSFKRLRGFVVDRLAEGKRTYTYNFYKGDKTSMIISTTSSGGFSFAIHNRSGAKDGYISLETKEFHSLLELKTFYSLILRGLLFA